METTSLMTAEELLREQPPHKRSELVAGRMIVREPAGHRHGRIANKLAFLLTKQVNEQNLGVVFAAETGFVLRRNPDTVRAPDVAFVNRERLLDPEPTGYAEMAPDLVVEVLSPDDRPGQVLAKVGDWLNAGVRLVWVVDPTRRQVRAYRQDGAESLLGEEDSIEGEDVLPGFSCPVKSVF
jgi:Uma2 family endonuclease